MRTLKLKHLEAQHILIIDDEVEITKAYTSYLDDPAYSVYATNSAQEAWQELDRNTFDLIITDLNMPHLNGEEFIKVVRKNQKNSSVPIVIASGCTNKIHDSQVQRDSQLFIIKKPFSKKEFLNIIEEALK